MTYHIEQRGDRFDIVRDGAATLSGIRPVLTLEDDVVPALALAQATVERGQDASGEYTLHRLDYEDADRTIALTLDLKCYAELLAAGVRFKSYKGESVGERPVCVAAIGGIRLNVERSGNVVGMLANYLYNPWWTAPYFGTDVHRIPPRTQSLLWNDGHLYHHLLPVCDDIFKTELEGNEQGLQITISAYDGGYSNFDAVAFVLASDSDPFTLPLRTAAGGMLALGKPPRTREQRAYPEPFQYLGWCSWDAFYYTISTDKVLDKAREFNTLGLPVRWFIFDAGWSDAVEPHYLRSFEANPAKFPQGLAPVIAQLKAQYGLRWVGVWHTINGHWNGIHPDTPLAQEMRDSLYKTNSGKLVPSPEAEKGFRFWDAWHRQLAQQGVDFVKVDHQGCLAIVYSHLLAIGRAASGAHEALEASVARHFDNCMINCMGMPNENVWHRPVSPVARNSDDFYPQKEDGFSQHALQNAYNAWYHGAFMWLDFDMWWTRHPDALRHAVLRAVSGGPIYVSDPIGTTEPQHLWPLILSDGQVLRCDQPGLPTRDCLLRDPLHEEIPLKMWNRCGNAGVVAAFNIHQNGKPVTGIVGPGDVSSLVGERFVVYEHFSRSAHIVEWNESIEFTLKEQQCTLYLIIPLNDCHTPIGLIDKYISPATIIARHTSNGHAVVALREGGLFAWVSQQAPTVARVNGKSCTIIPGNEFYMVDCTNRSGPVWIEIESEVLR